MVPATIIAKKRDGGELTATEIHEFLQAYMRGEVADYHMAAWAMAVVCRGMSVEETAALTLAMLDSGSCLPRHGDRPRVDKHSTGGLGDKTSLILAPLLATFELDVPMLSGRGLGITGGTLDKLEAFPGYRCDLTVAEIDRQLQRIGCVITGTTRDIAPADRRLYALRDVTGTVESIALITASIMSKKLAESLDALVLDVKFGSAAFMQDLDSARQLAESLVRTGDLSSVATRAILSDMNQPLGRMVGNACEVNEALELLEGGGPEDLRQVTLRLGAELLLATGRATDLADAHTRLEQRLRGGQPLERFQMLVESQAGSFRHRLPLADASLLAAPQSGYVQAIDGRRLGSAVVELGGGRKRLEDRIDHSVGLEMRVRVGESVTAGQPLVQLFAPAGAQRERAAHAILSAIAIGEAPPAPLPLIVETA
jgi:pyrimidine-nucleoside phosphorylase